MAPNLPNMSYISSEVILYGRFRTYNSRFTSGGRRICKRNSTFHSIQLLCVWSRRFSAHMVALVHVRSLRMLSGDKARNFHSASRKVCGGFVWPGMNVLKRGPLFKINDSSVWPQTQTKLNRVANVGTLNGESVDAFREPYRVWPCSST